MVTAKQPAELARDAIRLLATRRLPPTPDNYEQAYLEVSGASAKLRAESAEPRPATQAWPDLIRPLIRQWEAHQIGLSQERKREMLERVLINFGHDNQQLFDKLTALTQTWKAGVKDAGSEIQPEEPPAEQAAAPNPAPMPGSQGTETLASPSGCRPVISRLAGNLRTLAESCDARWPDLAVRAGKLSRGVEGLDGLSAGQFEEWSAVWQELLVRAEDDHELSVGLKRLVGLLFLNIGELVGDEAWLSGQVAAMQNLLAGELQPSVLLEAERSLRELAYKQGVLKGSLDEAKARLRTLITTFIDRIGEMSRHADGYHASFGAYSVRISQASDISELSDVVQGLTSDVSNLRDALRNSHQELSDARNQAEQAEGRIQQLEEELRQVSNLVREDQLTGTLNRRGMDEAFERELARSERLEAPMSIGLLDIDHFKKLNDSLGHQAGDEALRHLARVVKSMLRPTDSLARYGGEEFLVMLPNSHDVEAAEVLKRVQRELTRKFFMHDNERVLITFSAGVAERRPGESQAELVGRADAAMYRAKQSGRNRVERG
jgi:diguanylate cyclase